MLSLPDPPSKSLPAPRRPPPAPLPPLFLFLSLRVPLELCCARLGGTRGWKLGAASRRRLGGNKTWEARRERAAGGQGRPGGGAAASQPPAVRRLHHNGSAVTSSVQQFLPPPRRESIATPSWPCQCAPPLFSLAALALVALASSTASQPAMRYRWGCHCGGIAITATTSSRRSCCPRHLRLVTTAAAADPVAGAAAPGRAPLWSSLYSDCARAHLRRGNSRRLNSTPTALSSFTPGDSIPLSLSLYLCLSVSPSLSVCLSGSG